MSITEYYSEAERKEMESLGCGTSKHLMFFPVIGPTFRYNTALLSNKKL